MDATPWFKDAVIYQLHVKTFQDSDGDGMGDFSGLRQRLDYFVELGVTALWLLPFYPSPLRDDGYDIADYRAVHPRYGTLEDFRAFLDEAHARGLRVITELVLNHTSDQNAWFQRARRAPEKDSPAPSEDTGHLKSELADLVQRSLLQIGDMNEIQDRIKRVSERLSKMRMPKEEPPADPASPEL